MIKNFLFFTLVACIGLFFACKDKDTPAPTGPAINLEVNGSSVSSNYNGSIGDTIVITGSATAEESIKSFTGTASVNGITNELVTVGEDSLIKEYVISPIKYVIDYTASGSDITFDFFLEDFVGDGDTVSFVVTVPESPIFEIVGDSIGGFGHSTYGNIKNVLDDTLYFPNNVRINETNQKNSDIIFAFIQDEGWRMMSTDDPDAPTVWDSQATFKWPYVKTISTRFIKLNSGFNYSQIQTSAQLTDLYNGAGTSSLSGLVVGDVVAFRLDFSKAQKIGILQIEAAKGNSTGERVIRANIKVQR